MSAMQSTSAEAGFARNFAPCHSRPYGTASFAHNRGPVASDQDRQRLIVSAFGCRVRPWRANPITSSSVKIGDLRRPVVADLTNRSDSTRLIWSCRS
jgi:hypothetical protein